MNAIKKAKRHGITIPIDLRLRHRFQIKLLKHDDKMTKVIRQWIAEYVSKK